MYKIGPLFPHDRNGKPNIVISSSFEMREEPGGSYSVYPAKNNEKNGKLKTSLSITTEPINVPGIDVFMNEWLIPQLSIKQNDNTYFVQPSIYSQYRNKANGYITGGGSRFANLYDAVRVGYIGEGSEDYTLDDDFWQGKPDADNQRDKRIAAALKDESNWKPDEHWGAYQGGTMVKSKYDGESLRTILPDYNGDDAKRVWTPSLLYTYKRSGQKATMPGPVLMVNPGDNVKIKFKNNIEIPGLTTKDLIATSVVSNSSLGSGGSNGHGGSTTTNFHGHGLHVNSVGFGDNVVSRYTTGQKWTTNFDIENYHNMGSYWFHPHYHPSVNQQVYGGLSGNMQVGDPLSRVP
ncbi:MAG: multicopper oxidase domain-containing protein, partial [Prochlorococcus sp.]